MVESAKLLIYDWCLSLMGGEYQKKKITCNNYGFVCQQLIVDNIKKKDFFGVNRNY